MNCSDFYVSLSLKGSFPFLEVGTTAGVDTVLLPAQNDGISDAISIPPGFTLGNSTQYTVYVSVRNNALGSHTATRNDIVLK